MMKITAASLLLASAVSAADLVRGHVSSQSAAGQKLLSKARQLNDNNYY